MGTDRTLATCRNRSAWTASGFAQPHLHERDLLRRQDGRPMERPARAIRSMAHHSQQVHPLESQRGLPADSRRIQERRRPRLEHGRRFLLEGPPGCGWWKRGAQSQCIGRSRGGLTTKIHALVDSLGRPLHIHLTAGNIHDVSEAPTLIAAAQGKSFIADKGYDSNAVVDAIQQRRMKVVIPSKSNRKDKRKFSRKALPDSALRRELLLQDKALPACGHPLREDLHELPRFRSLRCGASMAGLNLGTGPSRNR